MINSSSLISITVCFSDCCVFEQITLKPSPTFTNNGALMFRRGKRPGFRCLINRKRMIRGFLSTRDGKLYLISFLFAKYSTSLRAISICLRFEITSLLSILFNSLFSITPLCTNVKRPDCRLVQVSVVFVAGPGQRVCPIPAKLE